MNSCWKVRTAPTRVTNMTGFLSCRRGFSLVNESTMAFFMMSRSKREIDLVLMVGDGRVEG